MGGSVGKLHVVTDRHVFMPGEAVTGHVYVHLKQAVHGALHLKLKGEEKTKWHEIERHTRTRRNASGEEETYIHEERIDRDDDHSFFKIRVPMGGGEHLAAGDWAFPFSFMLPPSLPSSFRIEGHAGESHFKAKIKYSLKAELCIHHHGDLKDSHTIYVNALPPTALQASVAEHSHDVKVCCCMDKGSVWMRMTTNKDAYIPGETASVVAEVDNQSSVELRHLRTKLVRHVHLRAGHHNFHDHTVVSSAEYEGVPPSTALIATSARHLPLTLSHHGRGLPPGCDGHLVKCCYHLEVEADIKCATDAKVKVPITLYHPLTMEVAMPVAPPGWNPTVMPVANVASLPQLPFA